MKKTLRRLMPRNAGAWALAARNAATNTAYDLFYLCGFHLLRKSYYLPFPDRAELDAGFWGRKSELVGVDMNEPGALSLFENIVATYIGEFRRTFPIHQKTGANGFFLINGSYMAVDAHVYYSLIRHFKPRRVIEIGAGMSTLLAGATCLVNRQENGFATDLVAIDPYPSPLLKSGAPGLSELLAIPLQKMDMGLFTSLQDGDILFVDSTHVLKAGGDVQLIFLEILPRLAPGVFVHIHDISLPMPYPRVYFDRHRYWNEQYLLQAFLLFNSRFDVVWPGNYVYLKHPEFLNSLVPEIEIMREKYPFSEPSAFWIRANAGE